HPHPRRGAVRLPRLRRRLAPAVRAGAARQRGRGPPRPAAGPADPRRGAPTDRRTRADVPPSRLRLRRRVPAAAQERAAAGRRLAPPGIQYQVALPRLDGMGTADGLADAQGEALGKLTAAWQGAVAPPVRMLPEQLTVADMELPEQDPAAGVPIGLGERDL